jgi:hypothetical protein
MATKGCTRSTAFLPDLAIRQERAAVYDYTTHSVKKPLSVIHTLSANCRLAVRQIGLAGGML